VETNNNIAVNRVENKAVPGVGIKPVSEQLRRLRKCMDKRPRVHASLPAAVLPILQRRSDLRRDEKQTHHKGNHSEVHESVP
jgi:hypothetical protein